MKTLIVYYSFTHNNEKLAKYLQKQLTCDITRLETKKNRSGVSIFFDLLFHRKPALKPLPFSLSDYDHIIFIGPIWAGKIAMPLSALMTNEQYNVKQYSFITLCGGTPGQKEKIEQQLNGIFHKKPLNVTELWVNDLLPPDQKGSVKFTSGFRIGDDGFTPFDKKLQDFVSEVEPIKSF